MCRIRIYYNIERGRCGFTRPQEFRYYLNTSLAQRTFKHWELIKFRPWEEMREFDIEKGFNSGCWMVFKKLPILRNLHTFSKRHFSDMFRRYINMHTNKMCTIQGNTQRKGFLVNFGKWTYTHTPSVWDGWRVGMEYFSSL